MFSNRSQLLSSLKDSLQSAHFQGFRVLLVLAGSAATDKEELCGVFQAHVSNCSPALNNSQSVTGLSTHIMHVPDQHSNADITDQINKLLGTENSCLVFDANDGFDPRMLAASAGTVVAGGLLILLTPPLQLWQQTNSDDPENASIFLQRFAAKLVADRNGKSADDSTLSPHQANHVGILIDDASGAYGSHRTNAPGAPDRLAWKAEQDSLLDTLLQQLSTHPTGNVVVVQGDRGRGKSALVGRALKKLGESKKHAPINLSLCANSEAACKVLLKHAQSAIPYFTVEQALSCNHEILIIEEAGAIPISILEKLLKQSITTIFVTTVQGYEGAGRGFAIRFAKTLDRLTPTWQMINPQYPIRWSVGDPLEAFINDAFLLNLDAKKMESAESFKPSDSTVREIKKTELLANETLLKDIYGLLLQAHYQTTPTDLRNMLDSNSICVFVQQTQGTITGAALVALEGNIPSQLHQPILQKQRRLNDQIIPQVLAQSSGDERGLSLRYARVVRIAIMPSIQNKGFGKQLYAQLRHLLTDRADCIGASFGADKASLSFWLSLGLKPIHYGYKVNPRSGLRAACLASSTHTLAEDIIDTACGILHMNTEALMQYQLREDDVVPLLLEASQQSSEALSLEHAKKNVVAFKNGHRNFIDTVGLLLNAEVYEQDAKFRESIEQAISQFNALKPASRRELEKKLRQGLHDNLD